MERKQRRRFSREFKIEARYRNLSVCGPRATSRGRPFLYLRHLGL